jgi:fructose-1,6-bisphosphatase II
LVPELLPEPPDRNLALELVRVTEAAAIAASAWMGRGDKDAADGAAVAAMRRVLSTVSMDGVVVIGEGEKDHAPMLYNGEVVGDASGPQVDVAVDPIDGTRPTALGRGGALSVIAVAERGSLFNPGPTFYMDKVAVGPEGVGVVDLGRGPTANLQALAEAKGVAVADLTAVVLERPRHEALIAEIRRAGARIRLITDGDVAGAISTSWPESGVDILFGIGGTPEGVIAACALSAMGGELQGRLWFRSATERRAAEEAGLDPDRVLSLRDLVASDNCFFAATGITDGELLRGVRVDHRGAITASLVVRSRSGTVRQIVARHQLAKLREYQLLPPAR